MGLGGILAAMAQGFGTGVVKNVEQGWKNEELDKTLNWREKEADKQRAFENDQLDKKHQQDIELENIKLGNKISEATVTARIKARYARASGGSGNGIKETQLDLTGKMQTIGIYEAQIGTLTEQLSKAEDKDQREALINRINALNSAKNDFLKKESTRQSFANAGDMGAALYMTSGGDMDLYNPKPKEAAKEVKATVSSVAAPAINSNNASKLASNIALQIAKQNQDAIDHIKFNKASEEAKEWAARQGQYKQIFIPRTF